MLYGVWSKVNEGKDTIILMNHHDVVDVYDYGNLIPFAYQPDLLKSKLKERNLPEEVQGDLEYMLLINSEPHQREKADTGILFEGSVVKIQGRDGSSPPLPCTSCTAFAPFCICSNIIS